ncbi:MAG: bifunctional transaldolase/phosoglucose isomerase [Acidobacteria bacterium]|nr:bifunctional transaldolase/phosoglucose isomerase [Acidobacteriota bacterium]MBP7475684.1 bifunctional transaldolase/phosoglucose isomerase [Pyrinomonadaceae bacterium]
MLNTMEYSLPAAIEADVNTTLATWQRDEKIARIWAKDASVWSDEDEAKWLDWLTIVGEELADTQKYADLANDIDDAGFTDVLLMGMGGSSLCPEVLAMTFGKANFHILDSTVPAQVKAVEDKLDLTRTLFIVASKSGSTLEPNCFKQYFFERACEKVGRENAGKQFIAITDPGSKMEQVAKGDGFRHIFYGKPEIGGRFSALSAFGMTAAAAMGIDVEPFLTSANEMVEACRETEPSESPAAVLGTILGICHRHGRDKLTIFTSPEIHDLGAWMEQLIAESTGKNGVAIIPVDREPLRSAYNDDRAFAFLSVKGNTDLDAAYEQVTAAGHPAVKVTLDGIDNLGQEFFRWEFATAVAGAIMQINPFNQPDVESAKIEARKITDEYEQTGSLPAEEPFFEGDGIKLFTSTEYASRLTSNGENTAAAIVQGYLGQITEGDYFGLLAYIEMNPENESSLQTLRENVSAKHNVATCLGFGPRFLHSTGQAYKGGAKNGVFLQITSDDAFDLEVPQQTYTFGVVKAAQSRGDFQVLLDRDRRALRVHLGSDVEAGLKQLSDLIQ